MKSHCDGEVWGLATINDNCIVTSADDNQLMVWDIANRKNETVAVISNESRNASRGGASTLSTLPAS